jgi:hypothetical protein
MRSTDRQWALPACQRPRTEAQGPPQPSSCRAAAQRAPCRRIACPCGSHSGRSALLMMSSKAEYTARLSARKRT